MTKKELFFPLNLQYFADEEMENSVQTSELAESTYNLDVAETEMGTETETELEETTTETVEVAEEKKKQDAEKNRLFAETRRIVEKEQKELDKMYAELAKGAVNPETNKPILTAKDYLEAIEANKRVQAKEKIVSAGIDPSLIEQLINEHPDVKRSRQAIEQMQEIEAQKQMDLEVREIGKIDKDIKSMEDLKNLPNFEDIVDKVQKGASLLDAYKIANFDKLITKKTSAVEQAAINQAKSKNHLQTTGGVSSTSTLVEIPESDLAEWKRWFPELSMSQLKEKYNKTQKAIN